MATKSIEKRKTIKGFRFKGRVRITLLGKTVEECSRTFGSFEEAKKWVDKTAKYADRYGVDALRNAKEIPRLQVKDAIQAVINKEPTANKLGKSKKANLKMMLNFPIAEVPLEELSETHLYEHCQKRSEGRKSPKPQTIAHDISNLCTALKDANTFYGMRSDTSIFSNARSSLQRHNIIARSEARNHRPQQLELNNITSALEYALASDGDGLPLLDIVEFAIETSLRRGEIPKIRACDIDWDKEALTVRDRKHPNSQLRHTDTIPLSKKALKIIAKQGVNEPNGCIFPYKSDSISDAWRKITTKLNIEDLRFHDLRAEAICRFFEGGLDIVEVSKISGHRNLDVLNNHYMRINVDSKKLLAA
ncbi:TPA: site-specific integrase [Vibrio parahaemolyticus]|nr:site-specific integrase [Vibrio parahaemolyticus]